MKQVTYIFIIFINYYILCISSYPHILKCNQNLVIGEIIMGKAITISNTHNVIVKRKGEKLISNLSNYYLGETLDVSFSSSNSKTAYILEASIGIFIDGGCNNKRLINKNGIIKIPSNDNILGDIKIFAAYADAYGKVEITYKFVLKKLKVLPISFSTNSPTTSISNPIIISSNITKSSPLNNINVKVLSTSVNQTFQSLISNISSNNNVTKSKDNEKEIIPDDLLFYDDKTIEGGTQLKEKDNENLPDDLYYDDAYVVDDIYEDNGNNDKVVVPTKTPSKTPTKTPSTAPTHNLRSVVPFSKPTSYPTSETTRQPSNGRTEFPTLNQSNKPVTMNPTAVKLIPQPSESPSFVPTRIPTYNPTCIPTYQQLKEASPNIDAIVSFTITEHIYNITLMDIENSPNKDIIIDAFIDSMTNTLLTVVTPKEV
jgi:hypothetical protein